MLAFLERFAIAVAIVHLPTGRHILNSLTGPNVFVLEIVPKIFVVAVESRIHFVIVPDVVEIVEQFPWPEPVPIVPHVRQSYPVPLLGSS